MASSRASPLSILLLLATVALSSGFAPRRTKLPASSPPFPSALSAASSRRDFFSTATAAVVATTAPLPAFAKDAPPITRALVTETFDAVRVELTSPTGVYATLSSLIENGSFEEILQYTKESDAYFRKAKIGKARKLLTDPDLKGEAVLMSNAVTFDLIGINRASRPGKENREEQLKYLADLKKDVEKVLELEKTIEVVDE